MSDLRQRMQVELAVRGLAADTQHAYLGGCVADERKTGKLGFDGRVTLSS
jgi:hypothetical protein